MSKDTTKPPSERYHIDANRGPFNDAFATARFHIRQDGRLVGLDKIRDAIAHEVALRVTGFPPRPFPFPRSAGNPDQGMVDVCDEVFARVVKLIDEARAA